MIQDKNATTIIKLEPFTTADFGTLISWIDSRELLITIAGTVFSYPLTDPQLQKYLNDKKSYAFNVVDVEQSKVIGHAEIYLTDDEICKLDKVLIGDRSNRGKGLGLLLINELLYYSFARLGVRMVELNVYDWNISGLKCYEKAGFTLNPNKKMFTKADGIDWVVLNMTITRDEWDKRHNMDRSRHLNLNFSGST